MLLSKQYTKAVESGKHSVLSQLKLNNSNKAISFTCHSPCVWDNGSPVKVIESSSDIQIRGDFSQMGRAQIVEYSPELVASEGIAQALQRVPNLETTFILQVEEAMKNGRIVATIQNIFGTQGIIIYSHEKGIVPSILSNALNTQLVLSEPIVNNDLAGAIQKLGIKKGDVINLEGTHELLFYPINKLVRNSRIECVFEGIEGDKIRVKRNGTTLNISALNIESISVVKGDLPLGLSEEGKQKLAELKIG